MKKMIFACVICALFLVGCSSNNEANSDKMSPDENVQQTLEQYMQAIANKDAEKLVELYGGSYQGLMNLSPETDPEDEQKIFNQYLELIPNISLKEILDQTEVSKDEYKFVITLQHEDGTLFQAQESDIITDKFTYTVKRVDGKLKVMELPPYQP
ncbi:hypothetical protein C2I18_03715 [Paenibacillus sp. PK3_47]|uniref:hypothetical protein n=1 Tax=Paenibacillus sp. PK3_47 TaxID=2072642 RepID=UPI00201D4D07|nr:hypothetical protein [Paenibacillus sp. PK3_47]UQZ32741.1 hypothetical protein C2I18_03715 [Paenibacillus sp. PK3_47]